LYMHEQIPQGVFVFDVGQGDVIMGVMERPVCNILTI
jgi:hypothetical protein